jgi:hypothetical protein
VWTAPPSDTIESNPALPRSFDVTSQPDYWSVQAYVAVLDALIPHGYGNKPGDRYYPSRGFTFCNIFIWDATAAMGVEIPHYYNPNTGGKLEMTDPNALEMSEYRLYTWLEEFGEQHGWIEVLSPEAAQQYTNSGRPAIATSPNHCAMIRPSDGTGEIKVAQAGGNVAGYFGSSSPIYTTSNISLSYAFATPLANNQVRYYVYAG